MISLSTALIDLSHLKQYIVWSIESTMMHLGLRGSDIVPLLEGFGCNAATVFQAGHQCKLCTKVQCVSLISLVHRVAIKSVPHYLYSMLHIVHGYFYLI